MIMGIVAIKVHRPPIPNRNEGHSTARSCAQIYCQWVEAKGERQQTLYLHMLELKPTTHLSLGGVYSKGCLIKECLNSTEIPKVGMPKPGIPKSAFRGQGFRRQGKPTLGLSLRQRFPKSEFRRQGFRKQGFRSWGFRKWADSGPP